MVPATGAVVDRPELVAALADDLVAAAGDAASATCVTVEGAGGVGKTMLTAVVCRREDSRRRYPGGLVWVTVGEQAARAELADLVNGVTEALTGARPSTSDPMWAGAALGEALDRRPDTLLVLDDVWSSSQVAPFLLGGATSRRLVTTRNRHVAPAGTPSVVVDTMSAEQAAEVLQMGLDRPLASASLAPSPPVPTAQYGSGTRFRVRSSGSSTACCGGHQSQRHARRRRRRVDGRGRRRSPRRPGHRPAAHPVPGSHRSEIQVGHGGGSLPGRSAS